MRPERILVVEHTPDLLETCAEALQRAGYEVVRAASGEAAEAILRTSGIDVVLAALELPTMGGLEVLRIAKEADPETVVILITGFPTVETVVKAMKAGASDYLVKPFSMDQLLGVVAGSLENRRTREAYGVLRCQLRRSFSLSGIVGQTTGALKLFDDIRKAAVVDANVLIQGESGAGKELVARAIHDNSARQGSAFLPMDCTAFPEDLLEAELFGYDRGTFTGARVTNEGFLKAADGGTLFLDEVCDLTLGLQARLLRALEDGIVRGLDGRLAIAFDVRVMAATNRDIHKELGRGRFREDLFLRIGVIEIPVPPLRDRREDIPLLAAHFLESCCARHGKEIVGITQEALDLLTRYDWPGNVRELKNAIERAVACAKRPCITPEDLPTAIVLGGERYSRFTFHEWKERTLETLEKEFLEAALEEHRGNVTRAAKALGIHRSTLQRLMRRRKLPVA